jgi:DNA polymerase theta
VRRSHRGWPAARRVQLLRLLQDLSHTVHATLLEGVLCGVAYHHAGLVAQEKQLLETAFRERTLHVLCCTSTLAVGVNLPAERVIIYGPQIGQGPLDLTKWRQMSGRAGRAGHSERGQAYLCCQPKELAEVKKMLSSELPPVVSSLLDGKNHATAQRLS